MIIGGGQIDEKKQCEVPSRIYREKRLSFTSLMRFSSLQCQCRLTHTQITLLLYFYYYQPLLSHRDIKDDTNKGPFSPRPSSFQGRIEWCHQVIIKGSCGYITHLLHALSSRFKQTVCLSALLLLKGENAVFCAQKRRKVICENKRSHLCVCLNVEVKNEDKVYTCMSSISVFSSDIKPFVYVDTLSHTHLSFVLIKTRKGATSFEIFYNFSQLVPY